MNFSIYNRENILVLGAGASAEYGLPVWTELSLLIREKVKEDTTDKYKYKKEIESWLEKIGEGKKYSTLDECIEKESVSSDYHSNGEQIEDEIFRILKAIFKEKYKDCDDGWINSLNNKILHKNTANLEKKIAFISYNYDDVLDRNYLNYSYLPSKHRRINFKSELDNLSSSYALTLYAHGNLFPEHELEYESNLRRSIETIKTGDEDFIDAVSCYESRGHIVQGDGRPIKIFILGLGGGLKINLGNVAFRSPIAEVHVTIRNEKDKKSVTSFLNKMYDIPESDIKIYDSCKELIEKNFDEDIF